MAFVLHFKLWQQKSQNQEKKVKTQKIENYITAASSKDFREKHSNLLWSTFEEHSQQSAKVCPSIKLTSIQVLPLTTSKLPLSSDTKIQIF